MNTHKQQGSAHLVIVVVLVLALLGALGFIFWQNFIQKTESNVVKTKTVAQSSTNTETKSLKTAVFDPVFSVRLGLSYPEDWTLERSTDGPIPLDGDKGATTEIITVFSPSKNIYVRYQMGANGGIGGACSPEDSGTISVIRNTALKSFPYGSFSENIIKVGSGYKYFAGIMSSDALAIAKVGGSECDLSMASSIPLAEKDNTMLMGAVIFIKGLKRDYPGITSDLSTISDIENGFKDSEYKDAKAIVLSTELK